MRRPIVFVLLSYSLGVFLSSQSSISIILIALVGAVIFIFDHLKIKSLNLCLSGLKKEIIVQTYYFLAIAFVGAMLFQFNNQINSKLATFDGKNISVIGEVVAVFQKEEEYNQIELKIKSIMIGDKPWEINDKILVKLSGSVSSIENIEDKFYISDLTGRNIKISGKLTTPPGVKNPRLFDYKGYLKTREIDFILEADTWQCSIENGKVNYFLNTLANFKYIFSQKIKNILNEESYGLFMGIMFGDTNMLGEDIYEVFQKNGTAHILSVSGIHVAIIYACIEKMIPNKNSVPYNILIIFILFCYSALSLFSPSVLRAVFMISVYIIGKLMFERYDLTACTAFTGLVLLVYNPFYLFSLGFQLSYMAVFVLAILLPFINFKLDGIGITERGADTNGSSIWNRRNMGKKAFFYMLPLFAIQIGMVPITAFVFNYFSLSAFITNVPVIIISSIILPIGLLMMSVELLLLFMKLLADMDIWGAVFHIVNDFINFLCDLAMNIAGLSSQILIEIMIWVNRLTAVRNVGYFYVESPSIIVVLLYYFLLFFICCEMGQYFIARITELQAFNRESLELIPTKSKNGKMINNLNIGIAGLIILIIVAIMLPDLKYTKADISFIDVGQGDCIHIRTSSGKNILIDGGGSRVNEDGSPGYDVGKKILMPYLLKNRVDKIDLAIVTHLHEDHFSGLASLSKLIEIKKLVIYEGNRAKEEEVLSKVHIAKENLIYVANSDRIYLEDDVYIDILYPDHNISEDFGEKDENEMNLLLKLNYQGVKVLITGDLTTIDEEKIILGDVDLSADILKVGHHGSKYSSSQEFLDRVDPKVGIIQVGKNNFGHPNPAVIEKIQNMNIILYRTDLDGAILFDINDGILQNVLTMKENKWHGLLGE
ncbi:MAG: DNA internalization-related competence protein ComEC/Rec2 [Eubacteriales bacterium]